MHYFYTEVQDIAKHFHKSKNPRLMAFANLLNLVADALHDIEWSDGGDIGEEEAMISVMKCIDHSEVLGASIEQAKEVMNQLKNLIDEVHP